MKNEERTTREREIREVCAAANDRRPSHLSRVLKRRTLRLIRELSAHAIDLIPRPAFA